MLVRVLNESLGARPHLFEFSGHHILTEVLGPHGLLRHATRILCTNSPAACAAASEIVLVCEGTVVERSVYKSHRKSTGPDHVAFAESDLATVTELAQIVPELAARAEEVETSPEVQIATKTALPAPTPPATTGGRVGAVKLDVFQAYLRWATRFGVCSCS